MSEYQVLLENAHFDILLTKKIKRENLVDVGRVECFEHDAHLLDYRYTLHISQLKYLKSFLDGIQLYYDNMKQELSHDSALD